MINKRIVFIGVLFLMLGGVVIFFLQPKEVVPPVPLAPPAPTITTYPQPTNVVFSFAKSPSLPSQLPVYTFSPPNLGPIEERVESNISSLSLSNSPKTLIRGDVYTKSWERTGEAKLTVTKINSFISLTFEQARTPPGHAATTASLAAQKFLLAFIEAAPGITLREAGVSTGQFDGLLILDSPAPTTYTKFLFSYTLDGYPIVNSGYNTSSVAIIADNTGVVRTASIEASPINIQKGQSVALLTPQQIIASLSVGRGVVTSSHTPGSPYYGVTPAFSRFIIEDLRVVYGQQNNTLSPAFLLSGTGTDTKGDLQKITFFLWATPENLTP